MRIILQKIRVISRFKKLLLIALLLVLAYIGYSYTHRESVATNYVTTVVKKGTLVNSIAASGSISTGNTTNISTKTSGVVKTVYVKNGDTVKKGDRLVSVTLDAEGVERKTAAWSDYLSAKESSVKSVLDKKELEIEIWDKKQAIIDAEKKVEEKNLHPNDYTESEKNKIELAVTQTKLDFDLAAAKYSHTDSVINASKVAENAAYSDYLDVSGNILAPADGIVNNLTLTVGSTLTANTTQSSTSGSSFASSQTIGYIRSSSNEYLVKVDLTEVDAPKVLAGQKVTLTIDAHSDKSFTGRVLAVDVSGSSNSGVSSYPATIVMDSTELPIYPNMNVSANIILSSVSDALIVPSSAIKVVDNTNTIDTLVNGEVRSVIVEIGKSNGTQTIVKSGLSEGDYVITNSASSEKNNNSSSVFSSSRQSNSSSRGGSSGISIPMGGPGF